MQIIIVGCGKVGTALAVQLSQEDNNVTVVDKDSTVIRNITSMYDVMGIVGNGASYGTLKEADIEHADLLIAVSRSDELNLLCCVIAHQAAKCHTIARVRNSVYRGTGIYPAGAGTFHDHQPGVCGGSGDGAAAPFSDCDRD